MTREIKNICVVWGMKHKETGQIAYKHLHLLKREARQELRGINNEQYVICKVKLSDITK